MPNVHLSRPQWGWVTPYPPSTREVRYRKPRVDEPAILCAASCSSCVSHCVEQEELAELDAMTDRSVLRRSTDVDAKPRLTAACSRCSRRSASQLCLWILCYLGDRVGAGQLYRQRPLPPTSSRLPRCTWPSWSRRVVIMCELWPAGRGAAHKVRQRVRRGGAGLLQGGDRHARLDLRAEHAAGRRPPSSTSSRSAGLPGRPGLIGPTWTILPRSTSPSGQAA